MLTLCWSCLSQTPNSLKNPGFSFVLPTLEVLTHLFTVCSITFVPGLLDVVQSPTPPTIKWFMSLPSTMLKVWAIYIVVLVKKNFRPKVYLGSATNTQGGWTTRKAHYNEDVLNGPMPLRVVTAIRDHGYHIAHRGILCWAPMPRPAVAIPLRAVMLLLECVFTLVFWTLESRTKDYFMPKLCPWSIESLDYDGCCTHSSLYEAITGLETGLTMDEINELEEKRTEKTKVRMRGHQGEFGRRPSLCQIKC